MSVVTFLIAFAILNSATFTHCIGIDVGNRTTDNEPMQYSSTAEGNVVDLQRSLSGFFHNFAEDIRSAPAALTSAAAVHTSAPTAAAVQPHAASSVPTPLAPSSRRLEGRIAFIAGVSDASGFGWSIAKALHSAGATVLVGTWVPMLARFERSLQDGSLAEDMKYTSDDGMQRALQIGKVYPLDIAYDSITAVPQIIKDNRRYAPLLAAGRPFTIAEVAAAVQADYGRVDVLVHAIANGPEVGKQLLYTSREGYLAALGSSSYSLISLARCFMPIMPQRTSAVVSLTYLASEKVIPGYGGGMSSAKAALESDTRTLAYELGTAAGIRVNTVSAGPFKSRAANAIRKTGDKRSFIDSAIAYTTSNAPLNREFSAVDVANAVLFLASRESAAITGVTLYVDNGMHAMGMAVDSASLN